MSIRNVALAALFALPVLGYTQTEDKGKVGPHTQNAIVRKENTFENLLKTKGAKGLVHGSVPETDMYVFTDGNIFGEHYSLIPKNNDIRMKLQKTSRHQEVTIFGKIVDKGTPQKHILVENIEPGKKWDPKVTFQYKEQPRIPELAKYLEGKKEIVCSVHAILRGGETLVVNYEGHNIPIYVEEKKWTQDLRSNDIINLKFKSRKHTKGPSHLSLHSENGAVPITPLDSMSNLQDKEKPVKGALVWFPISPGSDIRELWGVEEKRPNNEPSRIFAIYSDDKNKLDKIDSILRKAWEKEKAGFIRQTSSFYNPKIEVSVKGVVKHFFRNQRNPVIMVEPKDIKLLP